MRKKITTKPSQEELDLFHTTMKDAKRLVTKKIRLTPPPKPIHRPTLPDDTEPEVHFSEYTDVAPVAGETFIAYSQPGVSHKILRKLKKGQYNVEAVLDLHGMTIEKAQVAIDRCLKECLRREVRILLIIHGKGHHSQQPILKNKLNHWLREINIVLAFCSAAAKHGSRGAMYVLLKRITGDDLLE